MTIYNLINDPTHLAIILQLIRNGILKDTTILQHRLIYSRFYQIEGSKGERYSQLGEEYNQHPNSIQRIILKLNKPAR